MNLDIKQAVNRVLSTAGIPIEPVVLKSPNTHNPMKFYQSMDFSDLEHAHDGLESFVQMIAKGDCRAIVISGPAGAGKTSSVMRMLAQHTNKRYKCISGTLSPIMIYAEMYRYRNAGEVIVLDDIDGVYQSVDGVNIIKAATDSVAQRKISWLTASPLLKAWGIENTFKYNGAIILISNEPIAQSKSSKLNGHLKAIADRLFHIPMGTNEKEEQFHQLCFYIVKRGLLQSRGLLPQQEFEVLQYITDQYDRFPSITLRTATKLADLMKQAPEKWKELAELSLLTKNLETL
jgi:hypothetical protein